MRRAAAVAITLATLFVASPATATHLDDAYCCPPNIEVGVSAGALTCPGEEFAVSGTGFSGHGPVRIFFGDTLIGTVRPDQTGAFHAVVTAPAAPPGPHTLSVQEAGGELTAIVTCVAAGQAAGVAFTGVELRMWTLLLAGLLLAGTGTLAAGRRRARRSAPAR